MTNKEINLIRQRINRIRKTADGTRQACQQIMGDCDDLSEMLNDMVANNLWGDKARIVAETQRLVNDVHEAGTRTPRGRRS